MGTARLGNEYRVSVRSIELPVTFSCTVKNSISGATPVMSRVCGASHTRVLWLFSTDKRVVLGASSRPA